MARYARGLALAFEFGGAIVGGAFVGWWIDGRYGTAPWATIGLTVLGAVGGFVRLVQMARQFSAVDRGRER
ncbi:MAG: AtpZ/AtpI family protein [bacterium]|nr:AtpZ/AtpI family protein [bacterium]